MPNDNLAWLTERTPQLNPTWELQKTNPEPEPDGWQEWGRHVLAELVRLNNLYEKQSQRIGEVREDIAGLKVKSGLWGLLGGLIPILIALVVALVTRML